MDERPIDAIAATEAAWRQQGWDGAERMATAGTIMLAQQVVLRRISAVLARFDLTNARYEALVLLHLSPDGRLPIRRTSERLMVHPASMTHTLDRLEAAGQVRRIPHPQDRRTTLVEITDAGRDVARRAVEAVVAAGYGLGDLSPAELHQIAGALSPLRDAIFETPAEPAGAAKDPVSPPAPRRGS